MNVFSELMLACVPRFYRYIVVLASVRVEDGYIARATLGSIPVAHRRQSGQNTATAGVPCVEIRLDNPDGL